jgi:Protein of unknown function (DUF3617)
MNKTLFSVWAAVMLSVGVAHAADPPQVKEGLWSSHMQTIDQPGNKRIEGTTTICRSHAYDQYVKDLASKVQGCRTLSQNLQGHTFTSAMECVTGDRVIDTKETAIFQGDEAVHSETHATYTPAMYGVSETTMIVDQKYLGSCPAGSQPGDMKNADGTLINTWKH